MSWSEFLLGLIIVFFRTEGAVILWASRGVPFWQSFLAALVWTSVSLVFTFYGTGIIFDRLRKWRFLEALVNKVEKKTTSWLFSQKRWVILLLAFVPYTHLIPGFGSAIIIITRIWNIRFGILVLLSGNAFRWAVITYHIYQGVRAL